MRLSSLFVFLYLIVGTFAQGRVLSHQKWRMIIKRHAKAGQYSGELSQADIKAVTHAFKVTWPKMIKDMTGGAVIFQNDVVISNSVLTQTDPTWEGMVTPENIPDDVKRFVKAEDMDGVLIYNAFTGPYIWSNRDGAGVGWISGLYSTDFAYGSDTLAGWTHESLHAMAWYFDDARLGAIAPACAENVDGSDGTHCGAAYGYKRDGKGMKNWLGWYKDYLNGVVGGHLGLGPAAWAYGCRREVALGLKPNTLLADYNRRSIGVAGRRFARKDTV